MKYFNSISGLCIVFALIFIAGCSNNNQRTNAPVATNTPAIDEAQLVKSVYNGYKEAILENEGREAIKYLDRKTLKYYQDIFAEVMNADKITIQKKGLLDQLMILLIRHSVPKESIFKFTNDDLIIYAIDHGLIGKESVVQNSLGKITIIGNSAKGELIVNSTLTNYTYEFVRENGAWKLDLVATFPLSEKLLQDTLKASGQSEEKFLLTIVELTNNIKPNQNIWNPLK